jgi:hypothetical protein
LNIQLQSNYPTHLNINQDIFSLLIKWINDQLLLTPNQLSHMMQLYSYK